MRLLRRLGWWLRRRTREAELAEEMALHEELKERELAARGLGPDQVRAARRRAMGNATAMAEEARGIWVWPWLDRLVQDLRYAFRSARKNPTFSLGVIGITALGVGATTTIFSVVDGVVLHPLPYPAADRLVFFDWGSHSPPRFRDWQRRMPFIERWAAAWPEEQDLAGEGRPERLGTAKISPDFFAVFGVRPILGRAFTAGDYAERTPVVILGERLWRRRFGADSSIVGRTLDLSGRRLTVVGVASDLGELPRVLRTRTEVWEPLTFSPQLAADFHYSILSIVGRLKPGVTVDQARAELRTLAPRLAREDPQVNGEDDGKPFPIPIVPLQKAMVAEVDRALFTLFAAVGLMLLIACANVTNLYLARSTDRSREMAVRAALGAGRGRLTRQLVTESAALGLVAGVVGAGLAVLGVAALASRYPGELPRAGEIAVNGRVLVFAMGVSLLTGLIFGLVPSFALRERRTHEAIKAGAAGQGRPRSRLRGGLVIAEIALALVLLVGSGLLFHSFLQIVRVDPGFDPAGLVVAKLALRRPMTMDTTVRRQDAAWRVTFANTIADRLRAIPGVTDATYGVVAPMARTGTGRCCWGEREVKAEDGTVVQGRILLHPVGPGYFETIRAQLAGQGFLAGERFGPPDPVVISGELATRLYGATNPIGKKVITGHDQYVVRGVVTGLHQWGLDQETGLEIFVPYDALGGDFDALDLTVRTTGDGAALVPAIRRAVWDLEPTLPADDIHPMAELIDTSLAGPRFYSTLMGAFAGLALLLAAAGIYASMLYSVRQRTRELGIRVAMGAQTADISRMVVGDASRLALVGVGLGLVGAVGLARALAAFLFGIGPGDPLTFGGAAAALAATVLVAAYLPARRAARANPLTVLRAE